MKRHFQIILSLCFLIAGTHFLSAQTTQDASGSIDSDITWNTNIMRVTGDIIVQDDVTLTIAPGTLVEFQDSYQIMVLGTLRAIGTETDSIIFTVADTSNFSNTDTIDGGWNGIFFNNTNWLGGANGAMSDNDTSVFSHCRIEYVKSLQIQSGHFGAIEADDFSRVIISHCVIQNNYSSDMGGAIVLWGGSDIIIRNNRIWFNTAVNRGGGIFCSNSAPLVDNNVISNNRTTSTDWVKGHGGGICIIGTGPVISNNFITGNQAIYGAGISLYNSAATIKGNWITYNKGYGDAGGLESIGGGIYCNQTSAPKILNNRISNNQADNGGGISSWDSDPEIVNNLIVNNTATIAGGAWASNFCEGQLINNTIVNNTAQLGQALELQATEPEFKNNIIWGKGGIKELVHLQDPFARIHIENSIIQDFENTIWGSGSYTASGLSGDYPDFYKKSDGAGEAFPGLQGTNWKVKDYSPCVNNGNMDLEDKYLSGNDLGGNNRVHHSIIDIGAFEVHVAEMGLQDTIRTDTTLIADKVLINGEVTVNDDVTLTILPGTEVEFQGYYVLKVNGTLLAEGEPDAPINFSVADTSGYSEWWSPDGSWGGIWFDNSHNGMNNEMADNDRSVISHCRLSFFKGLGDSLRGAVTVMYYDGVDISDCIFENNSTSYGSGGIFADRSELLVSGCEFYNNKSDEGGAFTAHWSDVVLDHCIFMDNSSRNWGGAVRLVGSDAEVRNCEFVRNVAPQVGGAINFENTRALVSHNIFRNNWSGGRGGAISFYYEDCKLINNLFVNNKAEGRGGAFYLLYVDEAISMNNTVCNNWSSRGGAVYNSFGNHSAFNDIYYGNESADINGHFEGSQYFLWTAQSDLSFVNCNLQGGIDELWILNGTDFLGDTANLIDTIPYFRSPSEGPGTDYDSEGANWNLNSVSPCINSGIILAGDLSPSESDLGGRNRINAELIDMGAYEQQGGLPEITEEPINQISCIGDPMYLKVKTRVSSNFQWQKDGEDMEGQTNALFFVDSISPENDGNYQCIVSNAYGSVASSSVYAVAKAPPEILQQPESIWAVEEEKNSLGVKAEGTLPLNYQWYKDGEILGFARFPDLWRNNPGPEQEGEYFCEITNSCGQVMTDPVKLYLAPQICMVTVDTLNGEESRNLVIWEKPSTAPIDQYNIYRESHVAGSYTMIGTVMAADLSEFVDPVADPRSQAYWYKITAVDDQGNESPLGQCRPHKTIHLLTTLNPETGWLQLDWDPYIGFEYSSYNVINRSLLTGNLWESALLMSSSTSTLSLAPVLVDKITADVKYRIAVDFPGECNPTGNTKAGAGPYSQSMSNLEDNKKKATAVDDLRSGLPLVVYPNPFSDYTTISFSNEHASPYRLTIRDLSGKSVLIVDNITTDRHVIDRGQLVSGYYSIELQGDQLFRGRMIVE